LLLFHHSETEACTVFLDKSDESQDFGDDSEGVLLPRDMPKVNKYRNQREQTQYPVGRVDPGQFAFA
jgi:hypothetical protein